MRPYMPVGGNLRRVSQTLSGDFDELGLEISRIVTAKRPCDSQERAQHLAACQNG